MSDQCTSEWIGMPLVCRPMTVAELIDALKRLDQDAVVMVRDHNSFRRAPIARLAYSGEAEVTIVPWGKIYDHR